MLNRLVLHNVRRHAHTEVDFDDQNQIVLIAGRNGHGKTTLLEAIVFALYGETRHGKRNIAGMVRRGAEYEGMRIELTFTLGGTEYELTRAWVRGKSTASLNVAGREIMRTADAVTAEVTRILGMDAAGFRLATIAKQKEIDGLADLTPSRRRAAITRLLRLDAVSAAAGAARDRYNQLRQVAAELSAVSDIDSALAELAAAEQQAQESSDAARDSAQVVTDLDTRIKDGSDVVERHRAAQLAQATAQATSQEASAAAGRAATLAEQAQASIPDEIDEPSRTQDSVEAELAEVAALIATGEAARAVSAQRDAMTSSLTKAQTALEQIRTEHGPDLQVRGRELAASVTSITEQLTAAREDLTSLRERAGSAATEHAQCQARLDVSQNSLEAASALGATCTSCGQDVSEDHRSTQTTQAKKALKTATADLDKAHEQVRKAAADLAAASASADALSTDLDNARHSLAVHEQAQGRLVELEAQVDSYQQTLARLHTDPIDLDGAYARKAELTNARAEILAWADNVAARASAQANAQVRQAEALVAKAHAEQAAAAAEAALVPQELQDEYQQHQALQEQREAEAEIATLCAQAAAAANSVLAGAQARVKSSQESAAAAAERRHEAMVASKTASILTATAERMATEIRPALEGEISTVLQSVSEGRFVAVRVSDDYEVTVRDEDGQFHPVSEFSGGEADLIALAIRLALAQVVSRRHGTGGCGYLILDEVFGSQDEGRRNAILDGLRQLRSIYPQILLISHVGGIDEAADRVIHIDTDSDGVHVTG